MTRSLAGNSSPLGAQSRRLAPVTGSAVWGRATPRRKLPLIKVDWLGSSLADAHSLCIAAPPEDFHFAGSQNLAAPPPPQIPARPGTREPEVGDRAAPPGRKRRRRWRRRPVRPGAREASARVP